jgi:hypothetical protein
VENTVSEIDLSTLEVNEIAVGNGPHDIGFSADGDLAYVSNMKGNDISVINFSTNKLLPLFLQEKLSHIKLLSKNLLSSAVFCHHPLLLDRYCRCGLDHFVCHYCC